MWVLRDKAALACRAVPDWEMDLNIYHARPTNMNMTFGNPGYCCGLSVAHGALQFHQLFQQCRRELGAWVLSPPLNCKSSSFDRAQNVLRLRDVIKIVQSIVFFVEVFVIDYVSKWLRPQKRFTNQLVNKQMLYPWRLVGCRNEKEHSWITSDIRSKLHSSSLVVKNGPVFEHVKIPSVFGYFIAL